MANVTVKELAEALQLEIISEKDHLDSLIATSEISRPGLVLAGYYKFYPRNRVQVFGRTESTYLHNLHSEKKLEIFRFMAENGTPCFVLARNLPLPEELLRASHEFHVPILRSHRRTTRIIGHMTNFLESKMAPAQTVHGVLVDVFGIGVLITGESGVGKSETALELVQKGHRLVADDRVDLHRQDELTIVGEAPEILSHLIEIRGVGIVDVMTLFGAGAIRSSVEIDLIVHLENWRKDSPYDRLGKDDEKEKVLGVDIKKLTIPVKTGRNISIIIEVAAMNFRAKGMGYDPMYLFNQRLDSLIQANAQKEDNDVSSH